MPKVSAADTLVRVLGSAKSLAIERNLKALMFLWELFLRLRVMVLRSPGEKLGLIGPKPLLRILFRPREIGLRDFGGVAQAKYTRHSLIANVGD